MNPAANEAQDSMASEAYISGRRAGKHSLSGSCNPHSVGSFEYIDWENGRRSADAEQKKVLAAHTHIPRPCIYVRGVTCFCGGRGTCLDVA